MWIPIDKALPVHGVDVLAAFLRYDMRGTLPDIAHLGEGVTPDSLMWYTGDDYYDFYRVTHWMPLPEQPRQDIEEMRKDATTER